MNFIINFVKKKRWILILILVIGGIIFAGQKLLNKSGSTNVTSEVLTDTAQRGTIVSSISASGQIETANYLAITTSVNGIVKKVYVKEGDVVTKGQTIMEITLDSEGQKSMDTAYASYLKAKSSLESAKNSLLTLESTVITKEEAFGTVKENNSYQSHDERVEYKLAENDYLKAKSDYDAQKENIKQLEIALSSSWSEYKSYYPVITAPESGTIANIVAVEGVAVENSVSEKSVVTVASIKTEGTPIATLNVTEMDVNSISVGQKVKLTLDSISDETFTGSVVGIDKIGSVSSGVSNYPVMIKFDSDSAKVLPNMSVDAAIIIEEKSDVVYVPSAAITTTNNKKYVTVINGNSQQEVEVTIGITDGTNTEIVSGVNEGATVVVSTLPTSGFTSSTKSSTTTRSSGFSLFGGPGR